MEVNVSVAATDVNSISSVRLYWRKGGGSWNYWEQDNSTPYSFVLNVSGPGMGSGVYELGSGATDAALNIEDPPASGNETFAVFDLGKPESSLDPLPKYSGRSVNLTTTIVNPGGMLDRVELWANDSSGYQKAGESADGIFQYTAAAEGRHEFYSVVVSRSGEREAVPAGNDSWTIVDYAAPGVIASIPADGAPGVALDTDFIFELTETVDIATPGATKLDINGDIVVGNWSWIGARLLRIRPLQPLQGEKQHAATLFMTDPAGNKGMYAFKFSTIPVPAPRVASSFPAEGQQVEAFDQIRILFSASVVHDPGAETLTGPATFSPKWNGSTLLIGVAGPKGGTYTVRLDSTKVRGAADGVALDGNSDGKPGGDYILTFEFRPPPPRRASLVVIVLDKNGDIPLNGARVQLEFRQAVVNDSLTDDVGRAQFGALEPGVYNVTVSRDGYLPETKNGISLNGSENKTIDFKLLASAPANPAFLAAAVALFGLMVAMMLYGYIQSRRKSKGEDEDEEPALAARDIPLRIEAAPGPGAGEAEIKWEVSNADTGYVLMGSKDGRVWEDLVDVPQGIDSFTVDDLPVGSTQHFRLRARLLGGKTVPSNDVMVVIPKSGKGGKRAKPAGPKVEPEPEGPEEKTAEGGEGLRESGDGPAAGDEEKG
jgi:hypothetical protein